MTPAGGGGRERLLPLLLLLAVGTGLGSVFALSRAALEAGVPVAAYSFWYAAGSGLLLWLVAAPGGPVLRVSGRAARYYLATGFVSVAFPYGLTFLVVPQLGAGLTGTVYVLAPLLTYPIAVAMGADRFERGRLLGILLGVVGILLILLPRGSLPETAAAGWVLLALLIPLSLAFGNVYRSTAWPPGARPRQLAAGMLLAAGLLLAPLMLLQGGFYLPDPLGRPGDRLVLAQVGVAAVTFLLYFELQRRGGPVYLSQIGYVIAATGMVTGLVFFGERYSLWVWAALALVCLGVALVRPKGAR